MSAPRRPWVSGKADPQGDALLEKVVASENLHRAWAQVKRNKGASGVDGRDIAETETFLREHWPETRFKKLLELGCPKFSALIANSRRGPWWCAGTPALTQHLGPEYFRQKGLLSLISDMVTCKS